MDQDPHEVSEGKGMKLAVIALLTVSLFANAAGQSVWFQDDFRRAKLGPEWASATGNWRIEDSTLSIQTTSYDQLLSSTYYTYSTRPFSVQATVRGLRAGVFFCLDDPSTKALSQMVRFEEKSILTGFFDGAGEFTATSTFDLRNPPTDWTSLRIDVDPLKKRYKIFLDGLLVGVDTNLVFPSGYFGLQASDGRSEFQSVRIFADTPPEPSRMPMIGSEITFQHVSYVKASGKDITIYSPESRRLLRLTPDGRLTALDPETKQPALTTTVRLKDRTYSIEQRKIMISNAAGAVVDSISDRLVRPSCLAATSNSLFVVDPGARAVFEFDPKGRFLNSFDASVIGGFKAPRGIDIYEGDKIVVADYDKLVIWDPRVETLPVSTRSMSPTMMQISWHSSGTGRPMLEYSGDGAIWLRALSIEGGRNGRYTAMVKNLRPLRRYLYRFTPTVETIPAAFSHSRVLRFATPPADPGMMAVSRLPVLYMVYRTICYRDKYPRDRYPQIPDGRTISDEELAYLRQATDFNRSFYFRNSACRFVVDFDFYVVEDTLWLHDVGNSDPYWLPPNERVTRDFEQAAKFFDKKPQAYAGLICPYAWVNYPPRRRSALSDPSTSDSINIRQAVGGGTYGVAAPWKYGTTTGYTGIPFQDKFSRQDWLITHEFNHQVDALMDASGYPQYYHADLPWKMPGRFGEDFDFNAHILRNAERDWWLNLKAAQLTAAADADHDGVPDDDPSLPFDEKRLGANPHMKDTDSDGLNDLAEVMAGTSHGTDPKNPDTDGDGIADGIDPEPLYAINPKIPRLENAGELPLHPFGTITSSDASATISLAWEESSLLLSFKADKPVNVLCQIDADNDGWFHGFDNFQIRLLHSGDSMQVADYYLRDCSSWADPPRDRRDILDRRELGVSWSFPSPEKNEFEVTLKIPRNDKYGLRLVPGKKLSIRLGVQTASDLWVWDELFERNYMMQVELR
jgi:hypothetical protein